MSEDEAREWIAARFGAAARDRLADYVALLRAEAPSQSLIARSTWDTIWARHIVDSAQLVTLAEVRGTWLDIGSGGGLPGIVAAILRGDRTILVEPRRKRAEFLDAAVATLGLTNIEVLPTKAALVEAQAAVISARAVAPLIEIFTWTGQNVSRETTYLLPRGRSAHTDLEIAARAWHGVFHVEQSITDPTSGIVIARRVARR